MNKMNVCYATSDEFTIHTGISLLSLLDNNQGVIGKAFILDYGMTDESKAKLQGICDAYEVDCQFIRAKETLIEIGKQTGIQNFRDSYATYSRAFLDLLIPEEIDKLLYIDSDTVVTGSVAPIMDIDMTDKVLCGCYASCFYGRRKDGKDRLPELIHLLTKNQFYIQCGVLWYSLANWRRFRCRDMIFQTTKVMDHYQFADQTLINNSIPDQYFQRLPLKYNLTRHNYCDKYNVIAYSNGDIYQKDEILEALHAPVIIHYCGGPISRPWFDVCQSRKKQPYLDYKQNSPWKDVPLQIAAKPTSNKEKMRQKLVIAGMHTNSYTFSCILSKIRRVLFE